MSLAMRRRIADAWRVLTTHPRLRIATDKRRLDLLLMRAGLSRRHARQITADYFGRPPPADKP